MTNLKDYREITPEQLEKSPFQLIGHDWMLISAEKDGKVNTMTASWGGLGVMWGKNVAFIVIRPERYTKEFVDGSATLSLSFLPKEFKKQLGYLGSVSGRDEDKIAKSGLSVTHLDETPFFEEAELAIFCQKLFAQEYDPASFLDLAIDGKWYPEKDYHTLYIGEITHILTK